MHLVIRLKLEFFSVIKELTIRLKQCVNHEGVSQLPFNFNCTILSAMPISAHKMEYGIKELRFLSFIELLFHLNKIFEQKMLAASFCSRHCVRNMSVECMIVETTFLNVKYPCSHIMYLCMNIMQCY